MTLTSLARRRRPLIHGMIWTVVLVAGWSPGDHWWAIACWVLGVFGLLKAVGGLITGEDPPPPRPQPIEAGEGAWHVRLDQAGPKPVEVVVALREALPIDLKTAHDLARSRTPISVASGLTEAHALALAARLRQAGAEAKVL